MNQYHLIKTCFIIFFIGSSLLAQAQYAEQAKASAATEYAQTITVDDLKEYLSTLASDDFEGRETGKEGQKKAANYIAKHFKNIGLPPINTKTETYFQPFSLDSQRWAEMAVTSNDKRYEFLKDYYCFANSVDAGKSEADEVVFLGYGIKDTAYNDYKGRNVQGKTALVFNGEPMDKTGKYRISQTDKPSEWSTSWRKKMETAKEEGIKNLFIIVEDVEKNVSRMKNYITGGRMRLKGVDSENAYPTTLYISEAMAQHMLGTKKRHQLSRLRKKITKKGKSKYVKRPAKVYVDLRKHGELVPTENVLGYIEGTDPKLKDEVLIITAHYDHLGIMDKNMPANKAGGKKTATKRKIFNGADDDGSGTVAVMEIAQAFAQAKKDGQGPRRSVLIMTVSGEEKGLLGSRYYTDKAPIFPLENTIANLNVDMVGRIGDEYKKTNDGNYVYIIGSDKLSTELHQINEQMNKQHTKLKLDYKYNDDNDPNRFYYRSDHYNFAKNNIPVIFYFNGTHEDYHQETDTVDKINFESLQKRTQLIFHTAWQLANQDKRIEVDVKPKEAATK